MSQNVSTFTGISPQYVFGMFALYRTMHLFSPQVIVQNLPPIVKSTVGDDGPTPPLVVAKMEHE